MQCAIFEPFSRSCAEKTSLRILKIRPCLLKALLWLCISRQSERKASSTLTWGLVQCIQVTVLCTCVRSKNCLNSDYTFPTSVATVVAQGWIQVYVWPCSPVLKKTVINANWWLSSSKFVFFKEDSHNFAGIETQALNPNWTYTLSKSNMPLSMTIFLGFAVFIEKKTLGNFQWRKSENWWWKNASSFCNGMYDNASVWHYV